MFYLIVILFFHLPMQLFSHFDYHFYSSWPLLLMYLFLSSSFFRLLYCFANSSILLLFFYFSFSFLLLFHFSLYTYLTTYTQLKFSSFLFIHLSLAFLFLNPFFLTHSLYFYSFTVYYSFVFAYIFLPVWIIGMWSYCCLHYLHADYSSDLCCYHNFSAFIRCLFLQKFLWKFSRIDKATMTESLK